MNGKNDYIERPTKTSKHSTDPMRVWFWLWIGTLTVFAYEIYWVSIVKLESTGLLKELFTLNIFLGFIAFGGMFFSLGSKKCGKIGHLLIKTVLSCYVLFFIFSSLIYAFEGSIHDQKTNTINSRILIPTTYPSPTQTPTPKPRVNTVNTNTGSQIDCVGPDGKHFTTTQVECDKFNQAWKKPTTNTKPNTNSSGQTLSGKVNCWQKRADGSYVYNFGTIPRSECDTQVKALSDALSHFRDPVTGTTMVDCKFNSSDFSYDFGRITYDQCQAKSNAFWEEQKNNIKNRVTPTPVK